MRQADVSAIVLSDAHFGKNPPIFRSNEPDWLSAQLRPIKQIKKLQERLNNPPIIIAGDVLDHWKEPPEVINFLLENLPRCWAIPGQHDLPQHNLQDIKKTGYWTLVQGGIIHNLLFGKEEGVSNFILHGFPWGVEIEPPNHSSLCLTVAIIHGYIWMGSYGFPDAPEGARLKKWKKKLDGYDIAVFGDNHKGFVVSTGKGCRIINCGSLMIRNSDQFDYKPSVGLLQYDGTIDRYYLDTSKDVYLDKRDAETAERILDMSAFIEGMEDLGDSLLDYPQSVKEFLRKQRVRPRVQKIILKALENSHGG